MTLRKADQRRAATIRREVEAGKKLRNVLPSSPHLATALQSSSPIWGVRTNESQQLQSRLMMLPAELRNLIYTFTVASKPTALISPKDSWDTANYLNVMLTCRKLCREIQPIFFEENTLCFSDEALVPKYVRQLRQAMGASAPNISGIMIERRLERCLNNDPVGLYICFDVLKGEKELQLVTTESDDQDPQTEHESEDSWLADDGSDWESYDGERGWGEWRSRDLALTMAATDFNGDDMRHRVYHATDKKEVCECIIKKWSEKSNNDVMMFVENFAAALWDPAGLAVLSRRRKYGLRDRQVINLQLCGRCGTYNSAIMTNNRALEREMAWADSDYDCVSSRWNRNHIYCTTRWDKVRYEEKPSESTLASIREEKRTVVWAAYRRLLEDGF